MVPFLKLFYYSQLKTLKTGHEAKRQDDQREIIEPTMSLSFLQYLLRTFFAFLFQLF